MRASLTYLMESTVALRATTQLRLIQMGVGWHAGLNTLLADLEESAMALPSCA